MILTSSMILTITFSIVLFTSVLAAALGFSVIRSKKAMPAWERLSRVEDELFAIETSKKEEEAKLDGLRESVARAKNIVADANEKQEQLNEIERKLEPLSRHLSDAKDRLGDVQKDLATAQTKLAISDQTLLERQKETAALEVVVESLKEKERKVAEAEEQLGNLKEETEKSRQANVHAKAELDATTIALGAKSTEREILASDCTELEKRSRELKAESAGLEARVDQWRKQLEETSALANDRLKALKEMLKAFHVGQKELLDLLKVQHTTLTTTIGEQWKGLKEHMEKAIDAMTDMWTSIRPPSAAPEDEKLRELWKPVFTYEEFPESTGPRSESEMLADTKNHLQTLGLKYPDRVINAFHTCLKTNDMSLLTVLAGISGTGKSVLPRRYAEAMGMYFLNVSVQPRWDSPQDLFGFYNYMESNYKATELARTLVQFEGKNQALYPDEFVENYLLNERMCVILMDEMNLARVEYYFSEFLSKLEIRRDVRSLADEKRRAAEIVFESGTMAKEDKQMRVFPDCNILFVGTMNEDETTQALSNKVIDRANVLRFGRPRKLAEATTEIPDAGQVRPAMDYDLWQSWVKAPGEGLDDDDCKKVSHWTHKVNECLGKVKRPFGHRVGLGIEHYVANYPASGPERLKHAFSDQLEQRIMPKLRGLECRDSAASSSIDGLREIIAQMEDVPLLEAFNEGADQELFLWPGVDREDAE